MLKITCPNNPKHKRFLTTAHVMQELAVNGNGDFLQTYDQCIQVDHYPEKGNSFTCQKCKVEAIVENV